jgi:hypothetical protein
MQAKVENFVDLVPPSGGRERRYLFARGHGKDAGRVVLKRAVVSGRFGYWQRVGAFADRAAAEAAARKEMGLS